MAMHDTRGFRDQRTDEWWVARVLTAFGAGHMVPYGDGRRSNADAFVTEGVYFRRLGDETNKLRTCLLPAGCLNTVSHESVLRALDRAKSSELSIYIGPANLVSREVFPSAHRFVDSENLEWVYAQTTSTRVGQDRSVFLTESIELICLDDSALRRTIQFDRPETRGDFLASQGPRGLQELVISVKSLYENLPDNEIGSE